MTDRAGISSAPGWLGTVATLLVVASLEILAAAGLRVPNPPAFVLLAVVLAAFTGGLRHGLASAALGWLYFAWSFSLPGEPFRYTNENLARVLIWALATPAMAFLVGILKRDAERGKSAAVRAAAAEAASRAGRFALDALSQSETRYRMLAENMTEGILILESGRFAYANPAALALTGYTLEEILGKEFAPLLHPDFRALVAERHRRRSAGEALEARYDVQIMRRSSDALWVQISSERIDWEGRPAVLTIISDIGARKDAELQIRALNESLDQRVRERTAELESFSYTVSHDLRAPLRAIGGFARMVREEEGAVLSAEGRRKLGVVEANVQKMDLLVNDLLALARLSQATLTREDVDMEGLARSIADDQRPHFRGALVEVGPLPRARVDRPLITQALINLIDNALKYSSRRDAPLVEIGWDAGTRAYFVRDNGTGFDMKFSDKLFRTFERLHSEGEFPGTGIGLVIVKRVIERHGGRVWAHAVPDGGATFFFTLEG